MDTYLIIYHLVIYCVIWTFNYLKRNRVIKILGVRRIDGKSEGLTHVAPPEYFFFFYHSLSFRVHNFAISGAKLQKFLHISKKNSNFALDF